MGDYEGRSLSVSTAATAIITAMFAALIVLIAFWLYQGHETAERRGEERAIAASKIVATNTSWINALAWQALQRIDESLGATIDVNAHEQVRDINEAVENLPGQVQAYVVGRTGRTLYSTDPAIKPLDITDRDYFSTLAKGERQYVSALLVSRLNGKQIFVFSRRLERDGVFAGAAMVSFEAGLLANVWEAVDLGPNSTVSIIRKDGMLVARFPFADGPLDMSKYVLFTDYLPKSASGTYLATSPVDGASRVVAYQAVEGTDFIAIGSADYTVALRPFWSDVYIAAGVLILAAIGSLAAGGWIRHLLKRDAVRSTRLSLALEQNQLLLREIHHRVKNNLQSVQAVIRMQQLPADMQASLSDRIAAMVAVHEQIYSRDQFMEVSARDLLPAILDTLVKAYASDVTISYDIEDVKVSSDNATPLAMLANEVVTNSLKYAFPDDRKGYISVKFHVISERLARLEISDDGIGMDPSTVHTGMGTRLIRGVISQLNGTFDYAEGDGTNFVAELEVVNQAA